jgi:peptide deformylase
MILEIKKYPDKVLKKKCKEVKEITSDVKNLAQDLAETMVKKDGVGLAASQVGELKRIIAVQTERGPVVYINPKILKKSRETEVIEEGCLSFPGLFLEIKRAKRAEVEALDEMGRKIQIKAEGLPARVLQHEIDHLDGILFIDRLSFWQKLKLRKKLKQV